MSSINFVREKRKKLTNSQKQDHRFLQISTGVLLGVFVLFLVAVGVRMWVSRSVDQILEQQEQAKSQIAQLEEIESEYTIFVQKLKALSELFIVRKDKQEALLFFGALFGPNISISGIDYSASDNDILAFSIKAPSVFILEEAFETLKKPSVAQRYPDIKKSGISRSGDGSYGLGLTVILTNETDSVATTSSQGEEFPL